MLRVLLLAFTMLLSPLFIFGFHSVNAEDQPFDVVVYGSNIKFDVQPFIEDGRSLAPVRQIAESLGASVDWKGNENQVILKRAGMTVTMKIGHDVAHVNNNPVKLDVPPQLVNGRTFLPIRFIAESLQEPVYWDTHTKTVYIGHK
ncbi:copper amine oxidase N-terminal domain-containing protein [Ammoniphilus sp. 3BR4]|uniref:copper amine oxidase N-terminal domain-containing protein n=1 Tax=Ammoniphilus sp. 3BR4 TaxID=3158265 RepID=UPI0034663DD8